MRKPALKLVSLLAIVFAAAFLVPQRAAADQDDPPGRVARLSRAEGSVSFEPAGTDDWVTAVVNRPITTGDKLWSDRNSRAELHIGSASIRMGSNTGFSFLDLNDNIAQLQLTEGTLRVRVRRLERDENFEIDTPNLAFSVVRPGIYRVNVNEAGDTTIVEVRTGEGQVTGGGQSFDVRSGESGRFYGTDQLSADIEGLEGDDDFDYWCDERDRHEDHSVSRRYVSEDAVGYEDLDDYGGWRDTPQYGTVWFPHTTVVGWAPYRYGHWVYIYPWGYTWVDDEPWGFAPFHYGRWVVVGGVWGWVPCRPAVVGVAYVRPVYAPALVAWVGGPHFAIGVGIGGAATVGWFPLGPREVYVPSYRVSRNYVNNVNISNTTVNTTVVNNYYNTTVINNNTNITNVRYVNQTVPGAVTAAPARVVASAQPVARNVVRVDEREISRAPVVVKAPPVEPERQAVLGAGRAANVRPPEQVVTRQVVARTTPPPPPPRFETQQNLIKQNGGQPPAISQVRQMQTQQVRTTVPVRIAPPATPGTSQNVGNRPVQPDNNNRQEGNRPGQQRNDVPSNNRPSNIPQNNQRSGNERPNNVPPSVPQNRPPNNDRAPSVQPVNPIERTNNNAQPNRPPSNERNDRPPSARPSNPPPSQSPNQQQLEPRHQQELENVHRQQDRERQRFEQQQLEQRHQQELENVHRQQDQERQRVEQQQQQQRQQLEQQRADEQRRQQVQQQQQRQLEDLQRKHQQEQQQIQQHQQQEHQQQRQQERPQPPPPQARPQPQQERTKPSERANDKP
jgi:hypothetical protein